MTRRNVIIGLALLYAIAGVALLNDTPLVDPLPLQYLTRR